MTHEENMTLAALCKLIMEERPLCFWDIEIVGKIYIMRKLEREEGGNKEETD